MIRARARSRISLQGGTPCQRCPLRKRHTFRPFTAKELEFVEWFKIGELAVDAGATILAEGQNSPHLYTVLDGWAFKFKLLPDGRRQILNFVMPGDFIGMQGPVFKEMQHSVEAIGRVTLCVFPRERLWKLYETHPELSHDLVWLATRGERMADEHLLTNGRRSAPERIAFLALHLYHRCHALGMIDARKRAIVPINQRHVADALGISLVHTNKTLRRMTREGLLVWNEHYLHIKELGSLVELAGYDEIDHAPRPII